MRCCRTPKVVISILLLWLVGCAARGGGAPSPEEVYTHFHDSRFKKVGSEPLSTFSVDVDTASYSNVRRHLEDGMLPPRDAVRVEEMINYFSYDYPEPPGDHPFSVVGEVTPCPWAPNHDLLRLGLRGQSPERRERVPRNLVFLVDVSGSMGDADKLPLVKYGLSLLTGQLTGEDRLAVVTYAGSAGVTLTPTSGDQKGVILSAIEALRAGGSTNGGSGIHTAYRLARENFVEGGINRVILASDGDFNVGVTTHRELEELIEQKRESGIFLSVLGVGGGNLNDSNMETLADKGNGNYAYLDSHEEAEKVLSRELDATLETVAKDVKIQVEFNPLKVAGYRLIGYENRELARRDFEDDKKDAGEIGAGHSLTALYELIPPSEADSPPSLRYQTTVPSAAATSGELLHVRVRYKKPDQEDSREMAFSVGTHQRVPDWNSASPDTRFAAAVASFGMLLRDSRYKGTSSFDTVLELAEAGLDQDPEGYRGEFVRLVRLAAQLRGQG